MPAVDITVTIPTAGVTKALTAAQVASPDTTGAQLKQRLEDVAAVAIRDEVRSWVLAARREDENAARREALAALDADLPAPTPEPEPEPAP